MGGGGGGRAVGARCRVVWGPCLPPAGSHHTHTTTTTHASPHPPPPPAALARVEDFYDSIGGLVGYQAQCLELIGQQQAEGVRACAASSGDSLSLSSSEDWPPGMLAAATAGGPSGDAGRSAAGPPPQHQPATTTEFLVPAGLDLASPEQAGEAAAAVAAGIAALPHLAEVYPLGGAGDRLGLRCDVSGEALPTAVLQYCGRSLLENLVRDLQVRQGGGGGGAA